MKCPYCASEIADEALVCPTCGRELYLLKPLLERIAALEAELAARPPVVPEAPTVSGEVVAEMSPGVLPVVRAWPLALVCLLLPLSLLMLGHWLLLFVYDSKVIYLRLLALLLPLPFGFMFVRAARLPLWVGVAAGFVMAAGAVSGMSAITAAIDQTPLWPQNMVEVREFIEFAASIALSFITGLWLCHWLERRRAQHAVLLQRLRSAGVGGLGNPSLTESLTRWSDFGSAAIAMGTTAMSIYTGLKGLLG